MGTVRVCSQPRKKKITKGCSHGTRGTKHAGRTIEVTVPGVGQENKIHAIHDHRAAPSTEVDTESADRDEEVVPNTELDMQSENSDEEFSQEMLNTRKQQLNGNPGRKKNKDIIRIVLAVKKVTSFVESERNSPNKPSTNVKFSKELFADE